MSWIRDAVAEAESWEHIRASLQAHDPNGEDLRLRPFVFAFSYRLHERFTSTRERAGGPFGSMVAGEGWRFPPALADIEDADVEARQSARAEIDHPVVQARLGDLLWERRAKPDPHLAVGAAADGLLDLAADERWGSMERAHFLSRALELAGQLRDSARLPATVERMLPLPRPISRGPTAVRAYRSAFSAHWSRCHPSSARTTSTRCCSASARSTAPTRTSSPRSRPPKPALGRRRPARSVRRRCRSGLSEPARPTE